MKRAYAFLVSAVFVIAVMLPVLGDTRSDSFPLSTYPMFSGLRDSTTSIDHVVGVAGDESRTPLPPESVANDEVLQALAIIRGAIRQGPEATETLCQKAALWVYEARWQNIETVEVLTDRFDSLDYFDGDKSPISSVLHARCVVEES
jgi:hypothetical protein